MDMTFSCPLLAVLALSLASLIQAANPGLENDKAFVAKVSQGGMYEVEASKYAETAATAPDVQDIAVMEVHDHTLVNDALKKLAALEKIPVDSTLNATFKQRLDSLKSKSGPEFEAAYISDMEQIHDTDQRLFAKEATDGSENFQVFARQTDLIVKRHLGALHALDEK
jgi:putative membrane protein